MIVKFSRNFELETGINQFLSNKDGREVMLNKTTIIKNEQAKKLPILSHVIKIFADLFICIYLLLIAVGYIRS